MVGFLALEAAWRADAPMTFLWLGIALIIDGVDGPLARAIGVAEAEPHIDGEALDLIVDYLTYVVVPAAYLYAAGFFPGEWALIPTGFILVTSLYTFVRRDMKTPEADFRGFPAVWNLVAAALVVTNAGPIASATATLVFGVMTFAPVRAVHPIRVKRLRWLTIAMGAGWMAATGWLIADPMLRDGWISAAWWIASAYFLILCAVRSVVYK